MCVRGFCLSVEFLFFSSRVGPGFACCGIVGFVLFVFVDFAFSLIFFFRGWARVLVCC